MKKKKKFLGQFVDRQHSGGLSVAEYWVKLFQFNIEKMRVGKMVECLTDEQITSEMQKAFPNRKSSVIFLQPNRVRNRYNRGLLTQGRKPKIKSVKIGTSISKKEFLEKNEKNPKNI